MSNTERCTDRDHAPAIPVSIDEVDAQWLSTILQSRFPGAAVSDFTAQNIGNGIGLMGLLYRVTPTYENPDVAGFPRTLVVKLPMSNEVARLTAAAYRFYEKEVAFYNDLAPLTRMTTADYFHGAYDQATDNFVLAIEDLGHLRSSDQVIGCSVDDARRALEALARHHASFWDDPKLLANGYPWLPFGSDPPTPQVVEMIFESSWPAFLEFMGDEVDERILPLGQWIPAHATDLLTAPEGRAVTVLHGDYRLDNLFFGDDGGVTVLDWQIAVKGPGGYDFGYFVSQSLSIDVRAAHLEELAAVYLGALANLGVTYDEESFWYDVQRTLLFCLFYPISCMFYDLSDERTAALVREMARRSMSAIIDSGALSYVE